MERFFEYLGLIGFLKRGVYEGFCGTEFFYFGSEEP